MASMITPLLLALCAIAHAYPSEHLQHIPVPDYHPKLQLLGQHVDLPHVPTKIIRITKTVAIKVPVPYPVKIPHNVPYPVHVNKPYPVPVPQIIKVPQPIPVPVPSSGHHEGGLSEGGHGASSGHYQGQFDGGEQHHDLSSNGIGGGGYGNQFDHGYGGAESQQVSSPLIYQQQHQQSGASSYQSHQIPSYHSASPLSYTVNHTPYNGGQDSYQSGGQDSYQSGGQDSYQGGGQDSYHLDGQDSYQLKADASEYRQVASPSSHHVSSPSYQQDSHMYQVEAPGQSTQVYAYKTNRY